jgi:hypothetical protein
VKQFSINQLFVGMKHCCCFPGLRHPLTNTHRSVAGCGAQFWPRNQRAGQVLATLHVFTAESGASGFPTNNDGANLQAALMQTGDNSMERRRNGVSSAGGTGRLN